MKLDTIRLKMVELGVDRIWLEGQTGYTSDTLRQILAPNGNPKAKSPRAMKTIGDALKKEEERRKTPNPTTEKCAIVVRPSADELTEWNKASMKQCLTIEQWAIQQLNDAAQQGAWPKDMEDSVAAEEPTPYGKK